MPIDTLAWQIAFCGRFWADPGTANNNDEAQTEMRAVVDPDAAALMPSLRARPLGQDAGWVVGRHPRGADPDRTAPGGWNPFGTNGFGFEDASVGRAWVRPPAGGIPDAEDPLWAGRPVELDGHDGTRAVMVDLDPRTATSTQVFAGAVRVGTLLTLLDPSRSFAQDFLPDRMILPNQGSFGRAGAVFSSGVRPEGVTCPADGLVGDAIRASLESGAGIRIVWVLFGTRAPLLGPRDLAERIAAGEAPHNPVSGTVVGFLRPWDLSVPSAVPCGRRLMQPPPPRPGLFEPPSLRLGSARVTVDVPRGCVVLDLLNTIPEEDGDGSKVDLGPLALTLRRPDGTLLADLPPMTVAPSRDPLGYGALPYGTRAGTVDLPLPRGLDAELVATATFELRRIVSIKPSPPPEIDIPDLDQPVKDAPVPAPADRAKPLDRWVGGREFRFPPTLLVEPGAEVVPEQLTVYLDLSDPGRATRDIPFQLRGVGPAVTATVAAPAPLPHPAPPSGELPPPTETVRTDQLPPVIATIVTPSTLRLTAQAPGTARVQLQSGTAPPTTVWVRVLPGLTHWSWHGEEPRRMARRVYEWALRYYAVAHPGMNAHLDLSSPDAVAALAPHLLARLDVPPADEASAFERTTWMPVTRDLPAARRAFLIGWLQRISVQQRGGSSR